MFSDMSEYDLLIDLHKRNKRQGPGSDNSTKSAINLAGLNKPSEKLNIADIGCGTGSSTLILAESINAKITAIDLFDDFLQILQSSVKKKGLEDKITPLKTSMDNLPFDKESLDVIWSEGAIYNMGFEKGISYFKQFLKNNGILAVSEITWLTSKRPEEIENHWRSEYPEIATASQKIKILENQGFKLIGYFPLSKECWIDNYYNALEKSFDDFLARNNNINKAKLIIENEIKEIELYKKYQDYYSYVFYIARKIS